MHISTYASQKLGQCQNAGIYIWNTSLVESIHQPLLDFHEEERFRKIFSGFGSET